MEKCPTSIIKQKSGRDSKFGTHLCMGLLFEKNQLRPANCKIIPSHIDFCVPSWSACFSESESEKYIKNIVLHRVRKT